MTENADALAKAPDSVLKLVPDKAGWPVIMWGDAKLATLTKGKSLLHPEVKFDSSIKDMTADGAKKAEERVKKWILAMKAKHLEGLVKIEALANEADTPASIRALFIQIVEAGGIIARRGIDKDIRALDNGMRGHARRAGLVFGALDIFHHALMKPGPVLWRTALFSALDEQPMAARPSDNAVHIKQGEFPAPDHAARLGFRAVGGDYVRVDMIERLIKQAHEARKAGDIFEIDPALATSLGLSTAVHEALLKIAGFAKTDKAPDKVSVDNVADGEAQKEEKTAPAVDKPEQTAELSSTPEPSDDKPEIAPIYWRWKGMGKAQGNNSGKNHQGRKGKNASKQNYKPDAKARKPEPVLASAGGAFDALAALKESMKK